MRPALLRYPGIKGLAVLHHISIILLHETAFQYVECGLVSEPRVLGRLCEKRQGTVKILPSVQYVAGRVGGRGHIIIGRHPRDLHESLQGFVEPPRLEKGIRLLEGVLGKVRTVETAHRDA